MTGQLRLELVKLARPLAVWSAWATFGVGVVLASIYQASATGQGTSSTFKRLPIQKPAKPRPPAAAATPIRRSDLTEVPSFALPRPSQPRVFGSAPSGSWSSRVVRVDEETKVTIASPPPDPRRGSRADSKPRGRADDLQRNPRRSHRRRAEDRVPTEADLGAHVRRSWRDRSKSRTPLRLLPLRSGRRGSNPRP